MEKRVIDPDSGAKPPESGASAANEGGAKRTRRGKARQKGKARKAGLPVSVTASGLASDPVRNDAGASESANRKRKRRKRNKSQTDVSRGTNAPQAESRPGTRGGDATKRKDGKRGPQGRPLTPATQKVRAQSPATGAQTGNIDSGRRPESRTGRGAGHGRTSHAQGARAEIHRHESDNNDNYAALDLGTNNCRLLIAQPTRPGQFRVVDAFSRIVRLGEGLVTSRRLSADAMDRAVEALQVCATKLAGKPVRRMRLIATEACRAAVNGEEFLARVTKETGLRLEIINRETEARLAVSGCASLVGRDARSVVLFDIGGGSSEIAVIRIGENRSNRLANHITHWTSLPVGVVTLSERYGGRDVTPDIFAAMVNEVDALLADFHCPPITGAGESDNFYLIGTSGTVTTLAGVHLNLPRYDRRRVDGLWLADSEVTAMQNRLLSWDFAGRAANPCIGPDRADLVLAGCAILEAIRRRWPANRMRVADRGLREGLLTDMMADDGVWRRNRHRRNHSQRSQG